VGATAYGIYRSTSPGAETFFDLAYTNSYLDTDAAPGTTYYYKVTTVLSTTEGTLESVKSSEVSASWTLATPTGLVAASSPPGVGLTWAAATGASAYNVYRGASSGTEALYAVGVLSPSYLDAATVPGTTYYYKVSATAGNTLGSFESALS